MGSVYGGCLSISAYLTLAALLYMLVVGMYSGDHDIIKS